ncbi:hypothetical protein LTR66_009919 [Elasticomyces elasticus]|nr:hypothetical protein LTR66_009919 [Elasticomyces elasticus]
MLLVPSAVAALPVVTTLSECADFYKTVLPFAPQLSALPQQILKHLFDFQSLQTIYLSTNPLISAFALSLFLAPIFLVVSEINKNYSQVDRCWPLLPTLFNAHYALWAHLNGLPTQRVDAVLVASVIWSTRLTYNYWRKGGYTVGSEDYRWQVLREYISPLLFFVFNVVFISLAQCVLLFSITTPTYILLLSSLPTVANGPISSAAKTAQSLVTEPPSNIGIADTIFPLILVCLVGLSFVADNQQWSFQSAKSRYKDTAKPQPGYSSAELDRGFNTTGLFAYSRHPNFAAEQSIWVVLYQWACYTTFTYYNWTFLGAMSYLILFQASTWFTESITSRKYNDYALYQQRVGKFLPKLWGEGMPSAADKSGRKAQ